MQLGSDLCVYRIRSKRASGCSFSHSLAAGLGGPSMSLAKGLVNLGRRCLSRETSSLERAESIAHLLVARSVVLRRVLAGGTFSPSDYMDVGLEGDVAHRRGGGGRPPAGIRRGDLSERGRRSSRPKPRGDCPTEAFVGVNHRRESSIRGPGCTVLGSSLWTRA